MTENELLDKVNCDIAIWKNESENESEIEEKNDDLNWSSDDQLNKKTEKSWSIPSTRKKMLKI